MSKVCDSYIELFNSLVHVQPDVTQKVHEQTLGESPLDRQNWMAKFTRSYTFWMTYHFFSSYPCLCVHGLCEFHAQGNRKRRRRPFSF